MHIWWSKLAPSDRKPYKASLGLTICVELLETKRWGGFASERPVACKVITKREPEARIYSGGRGCAMMLSLRSGEGQLNFPEDAQKFRWVRSRSPLSQRGVLSNEWVSFVQQILRRRGPRRTVFSITKSPVVGGRLHQQTMWGRKWQAGAPVSTLK